MQEKTEILAVNEMGDDVVHFVGWGDFSLAKGRFLPIRADSLGGDEFMGFDEDGSLTR